MINSPATSVSAQVQELEAQVGNKSLILRLKAKYSTSKLAKVGEISPNQRKIRKFERENIDTHFQALI